MRRNLLKLLTDTDLFAKSISIIASVREIKCAPTVVILKIIEIDQTFCKST